MTLLYINPLMSSSNTNSSTLGRRLAEYRAQSGKSQGAFAKAHGISKNTQINYEQDRTRPSADYIESLRKEGADVEYILAGPQNRVSEELDEYESSESFEAQLKRLERATAAVRRVCNKYQDSDLNVDASFFVQVVYRYELSDAAAEDIMKLIRRSIPVRKPDN